MCEINIDWLPLVHTPNGVGTHNPVTCPDWESDWRPFSVPGDAQPIEPHQSEQGFVLKSSLFK